MDKRFRQREPRIEGPGTNPWKLTAIGMALVGATALITGLVVAGWSGRGTDRKTAELSPAAQFADTAPAAKSPADSPAALPRPVTQAVPAPVTPSVPAPAAPAVKESHPAPRHGSSVPSQSAITACNSQAQVATGGEPSTTKEVLKDGAIGALGGAAVGALGGAIVKGGSGAGKGAALGGLLGGGGGALYGLNKAKENDAAYKAAYARCMRDRGYTG